MKSVILDSSYVIDFLDVDFDSDEISYVLKKETDKIFENIHNGQLKDREVGFRAVYGKGSVI
jgi:hypothetical protein